MYRLELRQGRWREDSYWNTYDKRSNISTREAIVALHMYVNINTAVFYARWIRRRLLCVYRVCHCACYILVCWFRLYTNTCRSKYKYILRSAVLVDAMWLILYALVAFVNENIKHFLVLPVPYTESSTRKLPPVSTSSLILTTTVHSLI